MVDGGNGAGDLRMSRTRYAAQISNYTLLDIFYLIIFVAIFRLAFVSWEMVTLAGVHNNTHNSQKLEFSTVSSATIFVLCVLSLPLKSRDEHQKNDVARTRSPFQATVVNVD